MKLKHLGSFFILLSLLSSIFTYYPFIRLYIFPASPSKSTISSDITIEIPKIKAYSKIVTDVDPSQKVVYERALEQGVAHAKNTALPGEGFSFVFAHSSLPPWKMTRVNTPFLRLGNLDSGDEIIVNRHGEHLKFVVEKIKEVNPREVDEVYNTNEPYLVLMTCTPVGTSLRRLLVFAKKV